MRACIESLEQKRVDDNLFLSTLESEKTRLEKDNDDLAVRLENLQVEMEKSYSQAELALHEAEEVYNSKEMHLRSTIAQLEEVIELHRKELEVSHEKTNVLTNQHNQLQTCFEEAITDAEKLRRDITQLDNIRASLEEKLTEAEQDLSNTKHSVLQKEEDLSRAEKESRGLREELHQVQSKLKSKIDNFEDLENRHQELAHSSVTALEEAKAQHKFDLESAASESAEKYHQLQVSEFTHSHVDRCIAFSRCRINVVHSYGTTQKCNPRAINPAYLLIC